LILGISDRATRGTVEGAHFGVYGVEHWGAFYAAGTAEYAYYDSTTDRFVSGLGPIQEERARFSGDEWLARFEAGYKYRTDSLNVTLFAGFQVAELSNNAFTETGVGAGAVARLAVNAQTIDSDKSFVGVQLDTKTVLDGGWVLTPYARLSWEREFNTDRSLTASLIATAWVERHCVRRLSGSRHCPPQRWLQARCQRECRDLRLLRRRILRSRQQLHWNGRREDPLVSWSLGHCSLGIELSTKGGSFCRFFAFRAGWPPRRQLIEIVGLLGSAAHAPGGIFSRLIQINLSVDANQSLRHADIIWCSKRRYIWGEKCQPP
jgi:hypothetical protein